VLAGHARGGALTALEAFATTALTAGALFLAARFAVPRFIGALAGTRQKEIFVVAVLFLVLGSAVATSWAGVSAALGAFLAGLALSDSEYGHQALADIGGFRDAFAAIFFVSIGMLFDWRALAAEPVAVAVLLGLILVGKTLVGGAAVLALGYPARIAAVVGVSLAQIGEFSFVLLRQGLAEGLIAPSVYRRFLAAAIVTMLATPFLSAASHALGRRVSGAAPPVRPDAEPPRDHVVIVGFGHMGETVARLLSRAGVPFRVVDLDPDRVRRGRKRGVAIEYGDASNESVLRRAGIEWAAAAVVVLSDLRSTRQVVRHCRTLHPGLFVLARTRYLADIPALASAGADEVVAEEFESSLEIAGRTLSRLGMPLPWVEAETAEIRSSRQQGFRKFREPGA